MERTKIPKLRTDLQLRPCPAQRGRPGRASEPAVEAGRPGGLPGIGDWLLPTQAD